MDLEASLGAQIVEVIKLGQTSVKKIDVLSLLFGLQLITIKSIWALFSVFVTQEENDILRF